MLGNEVTIDIKNTKTATYQKEYIVNIEYLKFILSTKGIYMEKELRFKDVKAPLTQEEELLNSFYYGFIFKRQPISIIDEETITPIKNSIGFINELWYRYPVPGDGSCLFHSVFSALMASESYDKNIGLEMRDKIADTFTLSDFSQDGNNSIILMHQSLQTNMTLKCFKNVPITLTEEEFKNKVDDFISKNSGIKDIIKLNETFVTELKTLGLLENELGEVFKGLYLIAYLEYSNLLKDKSYWVDQSMILLLAEKLKINIIVISSRNMQIYKEAGNYKPDLLSVVIFNVDDLHFEPMYRYNNNEKQYVFQLNELKEIFA